MANVTKKKRKKQSVYKLGKSKIRNVYEEFQQFSLLTSLPGFRFISEEKLLFQK